MMKEAIAIDTKIILIRGDEAQGLRDVMDLVNKTNRKKNVQEFLAYASEKRAPADGYIYLIGTDVMKSNTELVLRQASNKQSDVVK